jgi:hypothetical protein
MISIGTTLDDRVCPAASVVDDMDGELPADGLMTGGL